MLTVIVCAQFLESAQGSTISVSMLSTHPQSLMAAMKSWFLSTAKLVLRIFVIFVTLQLVLETMKELGWIGPFVKLSPRSSGYWASARG
jgi:hypothetical protein